jgi:hypothetical protein
MGDVGDVLGLPAFFVVQSQLPVADRALPARAVQQFLPQRVLDPDTVGSCHNRHFS